MKINRKKPSIESLILQAEDLLDSYNADYDNLPLSVEDPDSLIADIESGEEERFSYEAVEEHRNRMQEIIDVYDLIIDDYRESPDIEVVKKVATAMYAKAELLFDFSDTLIDIYDETLEEQHEHKRATSAFEDIISAYKEIQDAEVREIVAKSFYFSGNASGLITTFQNAVEPPIRKLLAKAVVEKVRIILSGSKDPEKVEEAIIILTDLENACASMTELESKEYIIPGLYYRAYALSKLDRESEANAIYDDIVARFSSAAYGSHLYRYVIDSQPDKRKYARLY
jgi:hypothetical protein